MQRGEMWITCSLQIDSKVLILKTTSPDTLNIEMKSWYLYKTIIPLSMHLWTWRYSSHFQKTSINTKRGTNFDLQRCPACKICYSKVAQSLQESPTNELMPSPWDGSHNQYNLGDQEPEDKISQSPSVKPDNAGLKHKTKRKMYW